MAIEVGNRVSLEYVGRLDDGTVFDTSREGIAEEAGLAEAQPGREYAPLTIVIGEEQLIDGLKEGLIGMEEGDVETITVPPEKGYGEPSEDHIREYPFDTFAGMLQDDDPEEGMVVRSQDGRAGEVVHVDEAVVRVDFNHRLAGETLEFEVEIVDVSE